jgi:hypothetical protein
LQAQASQAGQSSPRHKMSAEEVLDRVWQTLGMHPKYLDAFLNVHQVQTFNAKTSVS